MRLLFRRLLLACLLASPLPALAQTEPANIAPEVVVTADRIPTDKDKVTGTVTVITNEEMQRRQLRTLDDVLRWVPGVSVQQSGGPGTQTSVFVRGANSNQTLLLLDGMNMSDPSTANGAVDFAHFLTENLDRVEVVRGPMSTLYGSAAVGGVINMVTKQGSGPINGAAFTELGTRLQTNSGAYVRGSEGKFDYNVTAAGTYAPGETIVPPRFTAPGAFIDNDPYRNLTLGSRMGIALADNAHLTWFGRYIDTQSKFDQVGLEDPNATEFTQQVFNRLQFDGSFFNDRWKPTIGISYSNIYRHDQDFPSVQNPFPFTQDAYYNGRRLQADWKNEFILSDQFTFVGGIDYDQTWLYSNVDGLQSWGNQSQTGLYGQIRGTFFKDLTVTLGGRLDANDRFGNVGTWRVGAVYQLRETNTQFKASYGTAFKAPSLFELNGAGFFCAGNPNLQAETSSGYEFGVEQGFFNNKVRVGATYFYNTFRNLIQCPPPFTALQNVANAKADGVESFLHISPVDWFDFIFEYTFTNARDTDQNLPLVRRPTNVFTARAEFRPWDNVRFGVGVDHVDGRNDFDAISGIIVHPSPYTLLRATASYDVSKGVQLFARAENILDQQYEEPEGFKAPNFQAFFGVKAKF